MNSLKKSIRRTSFETHNSLACYTKTITNETLQTYTYYEIQDIAAILPSCFMRLATNEVVPGLPWLGGSAHLVPKKLFVGRAQVGS